MTPDITNPPILVHAGRCPYELTGTTDEEILAWTKKLRSTVSKMLTISALKYWVRHSFSISSEEYRYICNRIDVLVKEPKGYASFI